jgi:hypothetical protein
MGIPTAILGRYRQLQRQRGAALMWVLTPLETACFILLVVVSVALRESPGWEFSSPGLG